MRGSRSRWSAAAIATTCARRLSGARRRLSLDQREDVHRRLTGEQPGKGTVDRNSSGPREHPFHARDAGAHLL